MALSQDLEAHLQSGITTLARCWVVTRKDGRTFGFTDHDRLLAFDGISFRANTGMTAHAVMQTTGLAVDNTEALGALSDVSVTEADIAAGRFDGAKVRAWLVNWLDIRQRFLQFSGALGDIRRGAGAFHAELRGLTEAVNQPQGQIYQKTCTALLGDRKCGFDLATAGYFCDCAAELVTDGRVFQFANLGGFDLRWFERGRLSVLSGAAAGLVGVVKNDRLSDMGREVELWDALRAPIAKGDLLRLEAGCDKRPETCQLKFHNFLNFRGFPHIPGEGWLMSYPTSSGINDGGSLR